ncbi:MAG: hypothetical protein AAF297_07585 [Planctomycetota bacterium]
MKLNGVQRDWLARALAELEEGRDRRFEDLLWLGFGDEWKPMLLGLTKGGCIEVGGEDRETPSLTPTGKKLLTKLERTLAKAG